MERRRKKAKSLHPEEGLENSAVGMTQNRTVKKHWKMYEKLECKHSKVMWRPPDRWKVYTFPRTLCNVARARIFFNGVVDSKKKWRKRKKKKKRLWWLVPLKVH